MPESILDIVREQLIPSVERGGLGQIAVARAKLRAVKRSPHFQYTPRKLRGSRVGIRSFSFNMTTAKWPKDHLVEASSPLLIFITSGKADLPFGNYWLHAAEGQGVFVQPNVPRKDGSQPYIHPSNRKSGFCSTINFTDIRGRIRIWCNRSHGDVHEGAKFDEVIFTRDDRAVQLLNQLQYHFSKEDTSKNSAVCRHLLMAFLLTIQSDLKSDNYMRPGLMQNSQRVSMEDFDPISKAQQYVRSHLHENLTLQNVARQVHMARTQFAVRFKQETKETFNTFVTRCRMEQAKVLLEKTDYTLTFVSASVGYRSLTYFHQKFLQEEGVSPREYREKKRDKKKKDEKANP